MHKLPVTGSFSLIRRSAYPPSLVTLSPASKRGDPALTFSYLPSKPHIFFFSPFWRWGKSNIPQWNFLKTQSLETLVMSFTVLTTSFTLQESYFSLFRFKAVIHALPIDKVYLVISVKYLLNTCPWPCCPCGITWGWWILNK